MIETKAAFFWAGSGTVPNPEGFIIPDELGRHVNQSFVKNIVK